MIDIRSPISIQCNHQFSSVGAGHRGQSHCHVIFCVECVRQVVLVPIVCQAPMLCDPRSCPALCPCQAVLEFPRSNFCSVCIEATPD